MNRVKKIPLSSVSLLFPFTYIRHRIKIMRKTLDLALNGNSMLKLDARPEDHMHLLCRE